MALGISVTNKKIKVPILITEKGGVIYSDYDKQGTITSFNLKTNINAPIIGNNKTFVLGDKVKIEVNDSLKEIFKKTLVKYIFQLLIFQLKRQRASP